MCDNYTSIPRYVLKIRYLTTWDNFYHFQVQEYLNKDWI